MGGVNPYIHAPKPPRPRRKYKITFLPMGKTVEVDPVRVPYGPTGQPGSILDIALAAGLELDHACGGVCACSTCHVIVRQGLDSCNESSEAEEDELAEAAGVELHSRLGCQTVPTGAKDVVVEIPAWNRNLVKETH